MHKTSENRISVRRPLAAAGFSWLTAQWVAVMTGIRFSLLLAAVLLLAVGTGLIFLRRRDGFRLPAYMLTVCALSLAATGSYCADAFLPLRALDGATASVAGTVADEPQQSNGRYYYVIEADRLCPADGETEYADVKLRLSSSSPLAAEKYDRVEIAKAYLYAPRGGYGYSSRNYYESRGIALTGNFSPYNASVSAGERPWFAFVDELRAAVLSALHSQLPDGPAGLACGVLLGDKSGISDRTTENFRACGISHLLVVSGLHISFLIMGLQKLLERLTRRKRLAAGLCLPALLLFMSVVGFTPSVVRSGIMMGLYLIGIIAFKNNDPLTSLGAAGLVLCVANPCAAGDVGLQLSFLSTLGIQLLSPRLRQALMRRLPERLSGNSGLRFVTGALSVSISASLFTLPVSLAAFGTVSLIAPLVNLFAELPAQLLLQMSLFAAAAFLCGLGFAAKPLALAAGLLANGLDALAGFFAALSPALPISSRMWSYWVVACLLLLAVSLFRPGRKRLPRFAALLAVLLLVPFSMGSRLARQGTRVTAISNGDGIAVLMEREDAAILLLYRCGRGAISGCDDALEGRAGIDLLLLPGDYDHVTALAARQALEGRTAKRLVTGYRRVPDELGGMRIGQTALGETDGADAVGDATVVRRLASGSGMWVCARLGETRVLIPTGKCDAADLPEEDRKAEVLVLGSEVKNLRLLACRTVLVSGWEDSAGAYCAAAQETGGAVYATVSSGTVAVLPERGMRVIAAG